jgi:hypothetical protein
MSDNGEISAYEEGFLRSIARALKNARKSRTRDSSRNDNGARCEANQKCEQVQIAYEEGQARLMALATQAAPKPLSILTTVTLEAQLLSMAKSAARPPKLEP